MEMFDQWTVVKQFFANNWVYMVGGVVALLLLKCLFF